MAEEQFLDLFISELKDIYSAEKQLVKVLPKAIKASHTEDLKSAITQHLEETKEQVKRLEKIFKHFKETASGENCEAMEGLVKEMEEIIEKYPSSALRDAAIIAGAQKVEHYEIATYGTLRTFAKHLEEDEIVDLLDESLKEESNADKLLTNIAEGSIFKAGVNKTAYQR